MSSTFARAIGPYRPLRKLGEGGMGVVYCAQDGRDPDRLVALKVLSGSTFSAQDDSARRFLRETRILERLRHPNIVSFLEVGLHGGVPYFAMEILTGSPLSAWAGRPWPETLPLLVQICDGMEYLASRAVVHRDLSPDNVFVVNEGGTPRAKILDFGIAKDTTAEGTLHNFTKTGLLMGKPPYWSPEQIGTLEEGETLDWRSDVYTLGVIFYRVLSGHPPFLADSPVGYIPLHLEANPPPLEAPAGMPPVPEEVVEVVHRMMAKRRGERPGSYREIVEVFEAALARAGSGEVPRPGLNREGPGFDAAWATRTKQTAGFGEPPPPNVPTLPVATRVTVGLPAEDETGPTVALATGRTAAPRSVASVSLPALEPAQKPRRKRLVLPAAAAVAVLGLVGWLLLRPEPPPEGAPPAGPPPAGPPATLALDAFPWGRIVSVREADSGLRLTQLDGLLTPRRLVLPPGRWEVTVASGTGREVRVLVVRLAPGARVTESVAFETPERALSLLE